MLSRAEIQRRIPHAGSMCLVDSVQHWDARSIVCEAAAPSAAHPLASERGVPAVAMIEYAAQAAAIHGSLVDASVAPRPGLLAKLIDVGLGGAGPQASGGALLVRAELLARVDAGCLYSFEVRDRRSTLAQGRLMIAFQA